MAAPPGSPRSRRRVRGRATRRDLAGLVRCWLGVHDYELDQARGTFTCRRRRCGDVVAAEELVLRPGLRTRLVGPTRISVKDSGGVPR